MATILITGGTGMIGRALTTALSERGHQIFILTRSRPRALNDKMEPRTGEGRIEYAEWDIENNSIDMEVLGRTDYIVHLAGANVGSKRWTEKRKKEIADSRIKSSTLLAQKIAELPVKPKAVISASSIGYYGDDSRFLDKRPFHEDDPPADDFLGEVCNNWEKSINPVSLMGVRLVKLRFAHVLTPEGGYLKEYLKPLRFGLAAIFGSGKQVFSWIHIDDLVRMIMYAMENEAISGTYNAVAPKTVSNRDFSMALARAVKGKFYIPFYIPSFVLRIYLGELSSDLFKSTNVSSEKILSTGFIFQYPVVPLALRAFKL